MRDDVSCLCSAQDLELLDGLTCCWPHSRNPPHSTRRVLCATLAVGSRRPTNPERACTSTQGLPPPTPAGLTDAKPLMTARVLELGAARARSEASDGCAPLSSSTKKLTSYLCLRAPARSVETGHVTCALRSWHCSRAGRVLCQMYARASTSIGTTQPSARHPCIHMCVCVGHSRGAVQLAALQLRHGVAGADERHRLGRVEAHALKLGQDGLRMRGAQEPG